MLPLITSSYFQDLVESFTSGLLIVNTSGDIYVANVAAAHILGRSPEDCLRSTWKDVFHGVESTQDFTLFMDDAHKTDRCNMPFATRLQRPDDSCIYLNLTTSPLVEFDKVFGIMILMNDVSAIHHMYAREKEILGERNRLQQERVAALKHLSQAVAHQIRNPIMTLGGLANLLLRRLAADNKERPYLEAMVEASRRLETIVASVSEYTAIALRDAHEVDVAQWVAKARELAHRRLAPPQTDEATWEVELEPANLPGDPGLLAMALAEVLTNALEAVAGAEGRIAIRGKRQERGYQLVVEDNGPGVEPAVLPFLTDPFFTTKPRNVGMGLTRANRAIAEHHGRLAVVARDQGGTRVTMDLPLTAQ